MDVETQRRIALNESRFRDLNERVAGAVEDFRGTTATAAELEILCECAISECEQMLPVAIAEYRRVRENPTWFLVRPDHALPTVERTIEHHEDYWVVEKVGEGADVSRERA